MGHAAARACAITGRVVQERQLPAAGVRFTQPPADLGPVTTAVLDDTCGNVIQIAAKK